MKRVVRCLSLALVLVAAPAEADEPPHQTEPENEPSLEIEPEPPEWGLEGPYRLDLFFAGGLGARVDDPPLFEPSSRAIPTVEGGLDLFLSRRLSLGLHYARLALASEDSGILVNGRVRIQRSVDALWFGLRADPLRSEVAAGYLRIGAALAWQHLDVAGAAWSPVTPAIQQPISCGGTALGFGIRAAVGADVILHHELRFLAEVGADNLRLTSDLVGGCGPGAGTATVVGLRAGFAYGLPL